MDSQAPSTDDRFAAQLPDRPTLLYDDGCRFCRATAEVLLHLSSRRELAFLPWSSEVAGAWLASLAPAVRDRSMHLKLSDGTLVSGERVLGASLAHVRRLRWIAWVAREQPVAGALLERLYAVVAAHREQLSPLVPNRPAVARPPRLR